MEKNYHQKYYDVYNKLKPKILAFEKDRKIIAIKYLLSFSVFYATIFAYITFLIYQFWNKDIIVIALIPIVTLIFVMWLFYCVDLYKNKLKPEYKNFKNSIKEICLEDLLKVFGSIDTRIPINTNRLKDLLQNSNLFTDFNTIHCDDAFKGVYNKVRYGIYELTLGISTYNSNTNKKSEISTYKGIILCYKFNKSILTNTIITTKHDFANRNVPSYMWIFMIIAILYILFSACIIYYSFLGGDLEGILTFTSLVIISICYISYLVSKYRKEVSKFKKIKLEDISFDKKYNIYGEDQIETRYLITTSFMERLLNLQTAFGVKKIKCSFVGDKIIFVIPTQKDTFEVANLFTSLKNSKQIDKFYNEIISIYNIIDYFKLNERLGL